MTTSIAEYYLSESDAWKDSIDFDIEETDKLHEWLTEALHYDTIPKLAEKVERNLSRLNLSRQELIDLHIAIQAFENKIYHDHAPVKNESITEELKKHQRELLHKMHEAEKTYLDVKYACDEFLVQMICQQNENNRPKQH